MKNCSKSQFTALILPGLFLIIASIGCDYIGLGNPGSGLGFKQILLMIVGLLISLLGVWVSYKPQKVRVLCILGLWSAGVSYVLLELVVSFFVWNHYPYFESIWLFEETDRTIHFDAARGFRLTGTSARVTRLTKGSPEYIGKFHGNNQGFPDRDDFGPKRKFPGEKRYVVFGDSFSAGQFNQINWPDRTEDLLKNNGKPLSLLNFALDGIGLGNWWSFTKKILEPEKYEIDGAVFAVYQSDLWRKFTVAEHLGFKRHMTGRVNSWDPNEYPQNLDAAKSNLRELPGFIISKSEFDAYMGGLWPSTVPRPKIPVIAMLVKNILNGTSFKQKPEWDTLGKPLSDEQKKLIKDMAEFFSTRKIPVWVIYIGSKEELLNKEAPSDYNTTFEFSKLIGAKFIDSRPYFNSLNKQDISSLFYPVDGHWNQKGADYFAEFMAHQF